MRKIPAIQRPKPEDLIKDPEFMFSLEQLEILMRADADSRNAILAKFVAPKFKKRLIQEGIDLDTPAFSKISAQLTDALCEYIIAIRYLPVWGERSSNRKFMKSFKDHAEKLQAFLKEDSYCAIVAGFTPAIQFQQALNQAYYLKESLNNALIAAEKSIAILGSSQLTTLENTKRHMALKIADILRSAGIELYTDQQSVFVKVLRAFMWTAHLHPDAVEGQDVLRLAKAIRRHLNALN